MSKEIYINKEAIPRPEELFETFKKRDDAALFFLKGGSRGGLEKNLKKEILENCRKWFEVVEGEEKELGFEEITARWGKGYLKYPTLETMKEDPRFTLDFLKQGEELIYSRDEEGFNNWMRAAKEISQNNEGLLRMEMLMAYYASGGQNILIKLKKGITREEILDYFGIDKEELDEDMPFQEFVKKVIVGETTAKRAKSGTLRALVADRMDNKNLLPCVELWGDPEDKWAAYNKLTNSRLVASNILNAIHSPGSLEELELEVTLLSENDLKNFSFYLQGQE